MHEECHPEAIDLSASSNYNPFSVFYSLLKLLMGQAFIDKSLIVETWNNNTEGVDSWKFMLYW